MSFGIYQPALLPRQIKSLYYLKLETRKPMTWHARRAVDLYLPARVLIAPPSGDLLSFERPAWESFSLHTVQESE